MKYKVGDRIYNKYYKPSNNLEIIEVIRADGHYGYRIKNHQTNKTYFMWEYEMSDYKLVKNRDIKKITVKDLRNMLKQMEVEGLNDNTLLTIEVKTPCCSIKKVSSMEYSPTTNIIIFS